MEPAVLPTLLIARITMGQIAQNVITLITSKLANVGKPAVPPFTHQLTLH